MLLNVNNVLSLFRYLVPLKRSLVLHSNSLDLLYSKMLCAQFCWFEFGSAVLMEKILMSTIYFCYFIIISPLKNCATLHFTELNYPIPRSDLLKVCLHLVLYLCRTNFQICITLFNYYFSLKKGRSPIF